MSTFENHCHESMLRFGQPFEEVHRWLDEFQGTPKYGMRHRRVRHHEAGIREAIGLFGGAAGEVARQHIIADLKEEGWAEGDPFPQDEEDFVKIGFF
jgi:hypothetical protein